VPRAFLPVFNPPVRTIAPSALVTAFGDGMKRRQVRTGQPRPRLRPNRRLAPPCANRKQSASIALCATPSHAGTTPVPVKDPTPGNSQKCTRVDFDHDNNGWGNGDQDAPGNSGPHNNAENGPSGDYPGNSGNGGNSGNPGGPCKDTSGNNGFGNGDQTPPANSADNNNAENAQEAATQKELQRIEAEALAKIAQQNEAAKASAAPQASVVVARREK
jgi:hypothetical protein